MQSREGISAVIITYNEERNIRRCLQSLAGVVDEIILLDSFSEDQTTVIASEFTENIIQREWEGYSASKNYANQQAHYNYILSLDADEALSDELRQSIRDAKSKGLSGAFTFNRLNNYCGQWIKWAGWYPDRKLRLFPRDHAHWEGDHVHEVLVLSPSSINRQQLHGDLHHYSYYTVEEHIQREMKYARLAAARDLQKGSSVFGARISALYKFLKMFVFQAGFLYGKRGYQLSLISARGKIWKHQAIRQLQAGRL